MSILIYLAGGMEHARDGISWRHQATNCLDKHGIKAWNPYEEEKKIFNFDLQAYFKTINKTTDYNKYNKVMKKIIVTDLDVISKDADMVLVKYDTSVMKGAGTHAEISLAAYLDIPVHVWLDELDIGDVPYWAIGCFTTISNSLEGTVEKIRANYETSNIVNT